MTGTWARAAIRGSDLLARVLGWILLVGLFWLLGLPWFVDAVAVALLGVICARARPAGLGLLVVSCLVAFALLEVSVRVLESHGLACAGDRPEDRFRRLTPPREYPDRPVPRYEAKVDQSCRLRGGDLLAIDPRLPHDVLEPRTVRFVTDSWGFPNDRDYHGQRLLLAGDSFVQGSGCDVRESLASVLREEHGLDTYSVAHPGVPDLYLQSIAWVSRQPAAVSRQPRALLFVFEGNDFAPVDGPWPRPMPRPSRYDWYKVRVMAGAGRDLASPRLLFAASRLAVAMLVPSSVVAVEVHRVGSSPVGFLGRYVDAARARRLWMPLLDSSSLSALARVAAVFFVPTKYRVYAPLLDDRPAALPDPPPGLRDLQRFFGALRTPVVDLTPVLRASARKLQTEGKYVYWRDDTHWNPLGIRAAARVVAQTVRRVVAEGEEGVRRGSGAVADAPSATGRSGASSRGASTPAE